MTTVTTTVAATLGGKLLRNSAKLFRGNLHGMVVELVANARRAGASRVAVSLERVGARVDLVVADDGRGLSSDDAPCLLSLGGSANDAEVERREDAAGMGFFALGGHDVLVRSRDWSLEVPAATFSGEARASLTVGLPSVGGLSVRVAGVDACPDHAALSDGAVVVASLLHSGLVADLSGFGTRDGRHDPRDFLDLSDLEGRVVSRVTREALGLRLRVARVLGRATSFGVNFFGQSIPPGSLADLLGPAWARGDGVETVALAEAGGVRRVTVGVLVRVDFVEASHLVPRHPDRFGLVEDAGHARVAAELGSMVADLYAGPHEVLGDPVVAARNGLGLRSPLREAARRVGRELPSPSVELWALGGARTAVTTPDGGVDVVGGPSIPPGEAMGMHPSSLASHVLGRAPQATVFSSTRLADALGPDGYRPLAWSRVTARFGDDEASGEVEGAFDADVAHLMVHEDADGEEGDVRAAAGVADGESILCDGLAVTLAFGRGDDVVEVVTGLDVLATCRDGDQDDASLVVVRGTTVERVVEVAVESLDWYREDWEVSEADQRDEARERYRAIAAPLLGRVEETFRGEAAKAVERAAWATLPRPAEGETEVIMSFRVRRGDFGVVVEEVGGADRGDGARAA